MCIIQLSTTFNKATQHKSYHQHHNIKRHHSLFASGHEQLQSMSSPSTASSYGSTASTATGIAKTTRMGDSVEEMLQSQATSNILAYEQIKILEQLIDNDSLVVAETLLVSLKNKPTKRYSLRIVELRDEATLHAVFCEIRLLNKIGLHDKIMGLFLAFRHRQYMGLLQPPFTTLRDRIDIMHQFKKSGDLQLILFRPPYMYTEEKMAAGFSDSRAKECLEKLGVFDRDSVVYVLKKVIKALGFLNSKGLVHTQICSSSVFLNERCDIKLGAFLHSRSIGSPRLKSKGSKSQEFTGNPSLLPPEAFHEPSLQIKENFDTWAIGLFALEMITGKRMRYSHVEMTELARKFLDRTELPPTLEEIDPQTLVNGKQAYDRYVANFLATCLHVDHNNRLAPQQLLQHEFMRRPIDKPNAKANIAVEPRGGTTWELQRSLRLDMITVHTPYAELKGDLLMQICNACQLLRDRKCIPIFDEDLRKGLARDQYVAVDASLAFVLDEDQEDWSRDVLDVSNANNSVGQQGCGTSSAVGERIRRRTNLLEEKPSKDFQRCELVFFINRNWSKTNRQLFISLMFARWFERDLISFPDLVRVVDELDDVLLDMLFSAKQRHLSPYKPRTRTSAPDSVAFVTGLRRSLIDPDASNDPDTHRYNNIYVEVAFSRKQIKLKKQKMDRINEGDSVRYPAHAQPLYAAATYYNLNPQHLEMLEAVLLGQQRVHDWEFEAEKRVEDDTRSQSIPLTTLLQARRMNPNAKVDSEVDWQLSNQIRREKIWGDYRRDFMFRFAKYAVPYKMDQPMAIALYPGPKSSVRTGEITSTSSVGSFRGVYDDKPSEIEFQLARTRSKQEGDIVSPFKQHDDVESREVQVQELLRASQDKDKRIQELEQQLEQLMEQLPASRSVGTAEQQRESPVPPPRVEEYSRGLSRLPKRNAWKYQK